MTEISINELPISIDLSRLLVSRNYEHLKDIIATVEAHTYHSGEAAARCSRETILQDMFELRRCMREQGYRTAADIIRLAQEYPMPCKHILTTTALSQIYHTGNLQCTRCFTEVPPSRPRTSSGSGKISIYKLPASTLFKDTLTKSNYLDLDEIMCMMAQHPRTASYPAEADPWMQGQPESETVMAGLFTLFDRMIDNAYPSISALEAAIEQNPLECTHGQATIEYKTSRGSVWQVYKCLKCGHTKEQKNGCADAAAKPKEG